MHDVEDAVHVDVYDPPPILVGPGAIDRLPNDDPGIIHHHIGWTDLNLDPFRELSACVRIGNVESISPRLSARCADFLCSGVRSVLSHVGDNYLRSGRSDTGRNGSPIALSSSRHKKERVPEQLRNLVQGLSHVPPPTPLRP